MKVKEILNLINSFAPANTALSYDNTGLLLGDAEQTVTKAVVCLDATPDAIDFAKENNAGLIITHHPIIFDGLKSVLVGSAVYECLVAGISVISAHTNLDVAEGGVNDCLAKALGLKNITAVTDEEGFSFRKGTLSEEMSAEGFARYIKSRLGGVVRYTDAKKPIKTVSVCGGSGGSELELAKSVSDALVTADVKHNVLIMANEINFSIFDAGHFHTENVVVNPLTERLSKMTDEVEFLPFSGNEIKTV